MRFGLPGRTPWEKHLPSSGRGVAIFLAGLLTFTLFRHYVLESSDPWKCHALMNSGHWYDGDEWLIDGCDNVWYGGVEIRRCASQRTIVFAGDEILQGTFWAMANKLDHELQNPGPRTEDFVYEKDHVRLEFILDPYLNGSKLLKYVDAFHTGDEEARPAMLVVGPSDWQLETGSVEQFVGAVDTIAKAGYNNDPNYGFSSGYSQMDGPGDLLLFAPAQEPPEQSDEAVLAAYRTQRDMNDELRDLADQGTINLMWSFHRMTNRRADKFGRKFDIEPYPFRDIFARRADALFNLRCNVHLPDGVPNVRSCCNTWHRLNWQQHLFLTVGMLVLPAVVLLDWRSPFLQDGNRKVVRAFCSFMGIISLQHITDRTHIFEQVKRLSLHYENLALMVAVIFIAGALTLKKSAPPKKASPTAAQPDQPFLPRDQTEEWKGWMQALIITYHYNKAWDLDWFWIIIRMCVSSYLFLTGFGHTVYFLQKDDFAFKRFAAVMLRTNLLPVSLAFALRTTWLLYYYMPLSSFWYLVVYVTMACGRSWNRRTPLLLLKIAFAATVIHAFLRTPNFPESLVDFFRRTTRISFSASEFFHHRVEIDHYITFVGMLAAILYVWCKDVLGSDARQDALARTARRCFPAVKWALVAASAVILAVCAARFAQYSQPHFTRVQPVATIAPILAFTVLRNAHPLFRNHFSSALAWLGRYSGEMYVMQNHIWLAGDQEAVLRTGIFHGHDTLLGDRWRDLLIITPLYLIACSVIGDSTAVITAWFCTPRKSTPPPVASADSARPAKRPLSEVEMGLLSGKDADDATEEVDLNEKPLPRIPTRWESVRGSLSSGAWWPGSVGSRAVLLVFGLWVLSETYT